MTKNDKLSIRDYLATVDRSEALEAAYQNLRAEISRDEEKATANRGLYAVAHDVVMEFLGDTPMTVTELYTALESRLPEGFPKGKLQYAINNYWAGEVVKIDNGKNPFTYRRK